MVTKERIRSKEVREGEVYFKKLELHTPSYAAEQGLVVNGPVLTSHSERPQLIFQVDQITKSLNLNPRKDGGIGYDVGLKRHVEELRRYVPIGAYDGNTSGLVSDYKLNGWIAIVEPQGLALTSPRSEYYGYSRRNSEIKVKELLVFCHGCRLGPLSEGVISDIGNGYLFPVCSIENHLDSYRLKKEDSENGYSKIPLPKLKFEIKPDGLVLSEFQAVTENLVSPKKRLVLSETEPRDLWELVERAKEIYTPENPRPIDPFPISRASVVISRGSGYPVELYITTHDENGNEIGSIGGGPSSLVDIVSGGLIANPGDRGIVKGRRFPASVHYFTLKTETSLVVQPAEFYYDFELKDWKAKASYPVVLHDKELLQLVPFLSARNLKN